MPTKKGTGKAQTPKKAKRIIKIKRKTSVPVKSATNKTIHPKKRSPKRSIHDFEYQDKEYSLTPKQYEFCEAYLTFNKTVAQCVIDAGYNVYGPKGGINFNLARSIGGENLTKPNVKAYINKAIDDIGLTKEVVTREHAKMILQDVDLAAKGKGIDMHYKKTGEYAPEKRQYSMDEEITEALAKIASLVK